MRARSRGTAIAALWFRFAPPTDGNGARDDKALTIHPVHSVGADHRLWLISA